MLSSIEFFNAKHLCHYTANLGRGVELSFTFTALGSKVLHQIFVGITDDIITSGLIIAKI